MSGGGLPDTAPLAELASARAVLKTQVAFGRQLCKRLGDGDGKESWERVIMDMTEADMIGYGVEAVPCGTAGEAGLGGAAGEEAGETEVHKGASDHRGNKDLL